MFANCNRISKVRVDCEENSSLQSTTFFKCSDLPFSTERKNLELKLARRVCTHVNQTGAQQNNLNLLCCLEDEKASSILWQQPLPNHGNCSRCILLLRCMHTTMCNVFALDCEQEILNSCSITLFAENRKTASDSQRRCCWT